MFRRFFAPDFARVWTIGVSQFVNILTSILFPIAFVALFGHAAFGDTALVVSYSGLFLSLVAGAVGRSILEHGMGASYFARMVGVFLSAAAVLFALTWLSGLGGVLVLVSGTLYVLLAQCALHFVYYLSVRENLKGLLVGVFPAEGAIRIGLLFLAASSGAHSLALLMGCYVGSSALTVAGALALIWPRRRAFSGDGGIDRAACTRFVRWAVSGALQANFDRTIYATFIPAAPRAVFLFFHSLYTAAYGVIANAISMEVIAARTGAFLTSIRAFYVLTALGIIAACACTALAFAFAEPVARLTGFNPWAAAWPVIYALAFRSLLFVQSMGYGYIERRGVTNISFWPRAAGSIALLILGVGLARSPFWVSSLSLLVMAILSFATVVWVRRLKAHPDAEAASVPAAGEIEAETAGLVA